jgi:DNA-binding NarL/FixJ family response regulator
MKDISVAIVEDDPDFREAMGALINGADGFRCTAVFASAVEAVIGLPESLVNIVLMDIQLPGMSGIECVSILKDKMPDTQFMMVTVFEDDEHIFNALKAGALGYVLKRTSAAKLLEAVREMHNGGSPMSPEIARRVVNSHHLLKKNSPLELLTEREKQIVTLLSKGFLYKEIAVQLEVSFETVKKHIQNIYQKLQAQNKIEALNKVLGK